MTTEKPGFEGEEEGLMKGGDYFGWNMPEGGVPNRRENRKDTLSPEKSVMIPEGFEDEDDQEGVSSLAIDSAREVLTKESEVSEGSQARKTGIVEQTENVARLLAGDDVKNSNISRVATMNLPGSQKQA